LFCCIQQKALGHLKALFLKLSVTTQNGKESEAAPQFLQKLRALVNVIGNGVATLAVARWEKEIDRKTLQKNLA
jgi:hypothetical protein